MPPRKRAASTVSSAFVPETDSPLVQASDVAPPSLTDLPVLQGSFTTSVTASLARPFALFSLSRFGFGSPIPKAPAGTLLEPPSSLYDRLHASTLKHGRDSTPSAGEDIRTILKALSGLQTYLKETSEYLVHLSSGKHTSGHQDGKDKPFVPGEQEVILLRTLVDAYAHGFATATSGLTLISQAPAVAVGHFSSAMKLGADLRACQLSCLAGLFFLHSYAETHLAVPTLRGIESSFTDPSVPVALEAIADECSIYLAVPFVDHSPPSVTGPLDKYTALSPLAAQARSLIDRLAQSARQLTGSKSKPAQPASDDLVREEDVLAALSLLDAYSVHIAEYERILPVWSEQKPGPKKRGRPKKVIQPASFWVAARSEDKHQGGTELGPDWGAATQAMWTRLGVEAKLLATELGMGMATGDMAAAKRRAHQRLKKMGEESGDFAVKVEGSKEGVELQDRETTPVLVTVVGETGTTRSEGDEDTQEEGEIEEEDVKWEDESERRLAHCLREMAAIVRRSGSARLLVEPLQASDLSQILSAVPGALPTDGSDRTGPFKPAEHGHSSGRDVSTNRHGRNSHSNSDSESGENEDSDEDSDSDESDDPEPPSCPLRTLFALHDRYEEQRLAVWLTLPKNERGGMGTFMRGGLGHGPLGTQGEVGLSWDELGRELVGLMSRNELLRVGLPRDKLDKWVELSVVQKMKKRRKRSKKSEPQQHSE